MLPESFFVEEMQCGFRVTEERKKLWGVLLDLFEKVIDLCEQHHLRYYAIFGTLLGAVRHQGFVPWDDDVDIAMPRKDYDRFAEIAQKELAYPYFFQTTLNEEGYYRYPMRIRRSDTTCMLSNERKRSYNRGIFISIFPLDGAPSSAVRRRFQDVAAAFYHRMLKHYLEIPFRSFRLPGKIFHLFAVPYCKVFGYKHLFRRLHKLYARYPWNTSDRVLIAPALCRNETLWHRDDFEKVAYLHFAHLKIAAPAGYHRTLAETYGKLFGGNYMEFPAKDQRCERTHGHIVDTEKPYTQYQ